MTVLFSEHALEQCRERGVSISEVKEAVQKGAKHLQHDNNIVSIYRHMKVIFKKVEETYFIITVMIRKEHEK